MGAKKSAKRAPPKAGSVRTPRIWTIGYEGRTVQNLVETLRAARIERVVDIRELPLSRRPGFSKRGLAEGLARAGIAYTHLRALGTPPAVRHAYKAGGGFDELRSAYLAHLAENEDAIDELKTIARAERAALLCVEREPGACHRSVLAERLAEDGWAALDL